MKRILYRGTVRSGAVQPDDSSALVSRLIKAEGTRVLVTVEDAAPKTLPQLGYFFAEVVPRWAEETGHTDDEMYEALWLSFMPLRAVTNRLTGEVQRYRPRLSDATKEEASEFLDRCIREASLQGFVVREPSYR